MPRALRARWTDARARKRYAELLLRASKLALAAHGVLAEAALELGRGAGTGDQVRRVGRAHAAATKPALPCRPHPCWSGEVQRWLPVEGAPACEPARALRSREPGSRRGQRDALAASDRLI